MSPEARARLAQQQAELIRALLDGQPPPAGFDADRIRLAGRALAQKRARVARGLEASSPEVASLASGGLWDFVASWLASRRGGTSR